MADVPSVPSFDSTPHYGKKNLTLYTQGSQGVICFEKPELTEA
jgi:hypothetical protein